MGLKSSPYNAIQGLLFAEEVLRGNPNDPENIFRWSDLRLNLPGSSDYCPGQPWISKVRKDGATACDFIVYFDDTRAGGNGWAEARRACRVIGMKLSYLGLQDAARKRRAPSQTPGPWAGSVVGIEGEGVYIMVTQER
jgi:hypothetical protein